MWIRLPVVYSDGVELLPGDRVTECNLETCRYPDADIEAVKDTVKRLKKETGRRWIVVSIKGSLRTIDWAALTDIRPKGETDGTGSRRRESGGQQIAVG